MSKNYDSLKLENQLCFPLYACAKEIVRQYRPYLEPLDLTYTQYLALVVLWECESSSVKALGEKLYLDSGTLTPVLKTLEKKGYIKRNRSEEDERVLIVEITRLGLSLRDKVADFPRKEAQTACLTEEENIQLYTLLNKMLASTKQKENL